MLFTFLKPFPRGIGILTLSVSSLLFTTTTVSRGSESPGGNGPAGVKQSAERELSRAFRSGRFAGSGVNHLEVLQKARRTAGAGDSRSDRKFNRSLSGSPTELRILEEYGQSWTFGWNDYVRWSYEYDIHGNLIQEVRAYHNGSSWNDDRKWTWQYDGAGRDTAEVRQRWTGSEWVNEWKWVYTYDSTGNLVGELVLIWSGGNWTNYQKWTYTYNGNGDLVAELQETFPGGVATNFRLYTSTYSGLLLQTYLREDWNGSSWDPDYRIDYTHDGSGNFLTETRQDWNTGAWENSWRYTYQYDGNGNDTSWFFEVWVSGWLPSDLDIRHYNGSNQPISWEHSYYDAGWVPSWRGLFSWYGDGRWLEDVWYYWTGTMWDYDEKYFPVWGEPPGIFSVAVSDKWNMVSVPLTLSDYAKTSVFPTAVSSAFQFTTMYESRDVLENGVGYWVKFDGPQDVSMSGDPRPVDTIAVEAGWTMVGSVSGPVNVASITSVPPGLVTSNFFGFDNGYEAAATIEPGRAYWVKLSGAGSLIMDATGASPAAGRIRIVDTGEVPPPPGTEPDRSR